MYDNVEYCSKDLMHRNTRYVSLLLASSSKATVNSDLVIFCVFPTCPR